MLNTNPQDKYPTRRTQNRQKAPERRYMRASGKDWDIKEIKGWEII